MEAESFKDAVLWVLTLEKGDSNYTHLLKLEKAKKQMLHRSIQKEHSPHSTCNQGALTSSTVR